MLGVMVLGAGEDELGSDNEGFAGSEQFLGKGQGGSPRSLLAQRTLGDFLGDGWQMVTTAGHRCVGKRAAFALGDRCSGFPARLVRSVAEKGGGAEVVDEFPPLLVPVVASLRPLVPLGVV
jgi:hypothetical protein